MAEKSSTRLLTVGTSDADPELVDAEAEKELLVGAKGTASQSGRVWGRRAGIALALVGLASLGLLFHTAPDAVLGSVETAIGMCSGSMPPSIVKAICLAHPGRHVRVPCGEVPQDVKDAFHKEHPYHTIRSCRYDCKAKKFYLIKGRPKPGGPQVQRDECLALTASESVTRFASNVPSDTQSGIAKNILEEFGWTFVRVFLDQDPSVPDNDAMSWWEKDGRCIFAWLPSDSGLVAGGDFTSVFSPGLPGISAFNIDGQVHPGIVDELNPLLDLIRPHFHEIKHRCRREIISTGFSLGGALANLFALAVNSPHSANPADGAVNAPFTVDQLYSFGTAPVGWTGQSADPLIRNAERGSGCFKGGQFITGERVLCQDDFDLLLSAFAAIGFPLPDSTDCAGYLQDQIDNGIADPCNDRSTYGNSLRFCPVSCGFCQDPAVNPEQLVLTDTVKSTASGGRVYFPARGPRTVLFGVGKQEQENIPCGEIIPDEYSVVEDFRLHNLVLYSKYMGCNLFPEDEAALAM